jgi:hypothetical protein
VAKCISLLRWTSSINAPFDLMAVSAHIIANVLEQQSSLICIALGSILSG